MTGNTAGRDDADDDRWDSYTSGGGIYTEGLFAVTSTTNISNNQSIGYGGGIYVTSTGTLQIEYMPYIDGNTNTNNEASDIYLSHNADSGASAKIKIINSLYKTADSGTMAVPIGLRVGKTGTAITTGWANAAQAISDVFVSEVSGKALYVNDSNELYVDTGYLVTIDPNDGATTGTSGYTASITWADTASYRPSRTGYTFKGWTTKKDDASTLVLSASNTTYTPTANVTLYGLWEKHTYSITYKLNGGAVEGWTPSNFTASYGDSYMLVPNTTPTRSGYTFTGWTMTYYGLKNGGALGNITIALPEEYIGAAVPFEEPDGITQASITITANWTERTVSSIKITYRENTLQSYFVDDALKSFTITVTYDNSETAIVTVTGDMVSNFSTATTTTSAKTATITYGGKTATFTYTVSAGYAYTVEHYQENADDDEYTLVSADTQTLYGVGTTAATAKTYEGFTAQSFSQVSINEDGSTVVMIYYTRNVYTITFNMQGGSGGTTEVTVKHGQTSFSGLVPPTKAGYTFNGYYAQMNGGGKRWFDEDMAEEVPDTTANATVYAYWTERMVERIEIPAASQNQSYVAGDAFVPFNITVTYDNGETETVQVTASMLDNFSTESAVTSATATVTHMGKTATFTYTVAARKYNLTYNVNGATGTGPLNQEVAEGTKVYLPSAGGLTKTGYTFGYWMYGDQILRVGDAFTMPADDVEIVAYWALNKPTLAGTAGGALNYTYKGSAYNVTVNPSHVLGNEASYTFRWFRLNEGETNINSLYFSKDDLFEERCELLTTSSGTYGSYSFTNVADSGVYYCVVTVTHGENTSQTAVEYTVSIAKADQTITLSENEFTYSEGLTIDFADYVDGTGDGTLSYAASAQNGVTFDFANGVVSNITKAGGTFTLTVTKAATDNYNSATQTFTVTLNKGTQTLSVSGSPNPPTWKQEYQVSVSGNKGALSYAIISGNATVNESGVITATGTGQIRYSVTAAATNLYEAVTVERTVTFGKAAGYLAPDYATSKPTNLTICVGKTTDNITLPTGWSFASKTTFGQVGNITVSVTFTPSDTANYNSITENIVIAVADHTGGTAASCTTDQVCTECGEVLVEALGHNYNEQVGNTVRTTAANCQECNTYWYDCSRCGASAKNDANATDKWYTSNEAGEHNMSSDWTSENGQHFHKCTVSGCDHVEDTEDCDGGGATCQKKATCDTCGASYGSLGDHSYNYGSWGYTDENGHANNCIYCDAHTELQEHEPNVDAATEDTAKYCTFCGYVIEQQLNHVHSEGTEWKYDSEYHWHDCVGNDGQEYSKAKHTYDNDCDTDCNVCGATRTITHDYSKLEKNDTEHWYVCSVCGSEKANSRTGHSGGTKDCQHKAECATCGQTYGDFGDHAYDTTVWVSVDNEHHAHKCTLCDAYTDATDHYSADEATCTGEQLCDSCNYKMADALGHSYTKQIESPAYLEAEGENCQSHHTYYYACVRCDASSMGDTDTFFEGTAVGAHKVSAAWTTEYAEETNAGWHYHACTVDGCDYREDEGDCAGGENTCIALAICSTCQKAYGEYAEHTFGNTWEYKDATGHAHVCTVKCCNEHDEIKAHTPNIPAATEESAQYCTACQYQMAAQLNHTHSPATEWTSNATHHWKACGGCDEHLEEAPHSYDPNNACDTTCEVCNAVREVSHDFTGEWEKDASGHWHVCTKNGCSVTDTKQNH
ncbi:MAG: InlB B-repeat-containing protein, partial [Clostridia bacterium]|nr:InlB B-repeat-containing protein [Clostridia bacterium]